jgi:hypothetical protein
MSDAGLYSPLGSWDHQTPPGEPAFHLIQEPATVGWLMGLLEAARGDALPVYGVGRLEQLGGSRLGPEHGFLVLNRGTTEDEQDIVWEWLVARPGLTIASRFR